MEGAQVLAAYSPRRNSDKFSPEQRESQRIAVNVSLALFSYVESLMKSIHGGEESDGTVSPEAVRVFLHCANVGVVLEHVAVGSKPINAQIFHEIIFGVAEKLDGQESGRNAALGMITSRLHWNARDTNDCLRRYFMKEHESLRSPSKERSRWLFSICTDEVMSCLRLFTPQLLELYNTLEAINSLSLNAAIEMCLSLLGDSDSDALGIVELVLQQCHLGTRRTKIQSYSEMCEYLAAVSLVRAGGKLMDGFDSFLLQLLGDPKATLDLNLATRIENSMNSGEVANRFLQDVTQKLSATFFYYCSIHDTTVASSTTITSQSFLSLLTHKKFDHFLSDLPLGRTTFNALADGCYWDVYNHAESIDPLRHPCNSTGRALFTSSPSKVNSTKLFFEGGTPEPQLTLPLFVKLMERLAVCWKDYDESNVATTYTDSSHDLMQFLQDVVFPNARRLGAEYCAPAEDPQAALVPMDLLQQLQEFHFLLSQRPQHPPLPKSTTPMYRMIPLTLFVSYCLESEVIPVFLSHRELQLLLRRVLCEEAQPLVAPHHRGIGFETMLRFLKLVCSCSKTFLGTCTAVEHRLGVLFLHLGIGEGQLVAHRLLNICQ